MEGGNPVITEAQQELIKKHAALLGEDGDAIIQDIQEEAEKAVKLPADIFKLIESCCRDLGKRAAIWELSNEMIREREPERLAQVEAIREQVIRYNGARASGDNAALARIKPTLQELVDKYMVDVNKDEEDGLAPDMAQTWKDQVYQIVNEALLFFDGFIEDGSAPPAPAASSAPKPVDCLAPLRLASRLATYTTEAVAREIQDPDEAALRCYAKQLGNSKKEIMALSRSLMVGQVASIAIEATRLANEAGEAIKSSREMIRAALRGLGVVSDISEANGPPPTGPVLRDLNSDWAAGSRPIASGWPPACTPATTAWPPPDSVPRPRIGGAGGELSTLMRGLMGAQANDSRWPTFSGKYVEYPRFRQEWWAYRQTYHGHVRDELVCRSLKERSLASNVRLLMNDIDDLREAWNTLDTCFDRPEKYITEALDPVVKFRSYKAFDNGAIREYYSILRAAMMGARKAGLLSRLINDQTLPGILAKMPPTDWRQWVKERPACLREAIEEAFWNFVDQKWRDALNVAAAEPPAWGTGGGRRAAPQDGGKSRGAAEATKLAKAAVHVTGVDGKRHRQGDSGRACMFKEVMGCPAMHPPWHCKVFGKLPAREREKLIKDN